jgi:hypothetical protein
MDCWEVIERVSKSNVLQSTRASKFKRFPYGDLSKYKARFCGGGHCHIEGVDFIKTVAPVVNWTTGRFFPYPLTRNLSTNQVDCTATFIQACPVFFSESSAVLRSKHSLYGLKQSPRTIFKYLKSYLDFQTTIHENNAGALPWPIWNLVASPLGQNTIIVISHRFKSKLDPAGNHSFTLVMQRANILSTKFSFRQFEYCYIFSTIFFSLPDLRLRGSVWVCSSDSQPFGHRFINSDGRQSPL